MGGLLSWLLSSWNIELLSWLESLVSSWISSCLFIIIYYILTLWTFLLLIWLLALLRHTKKVLGPQTIGNQQRFHWGGTKAPCSNQYPMFLHVRLKMNHHLLLLHHLHHHHDYCKLLSTVLSSLSLCHYYCHYYTYHWVYLTALSRGGAPCYKLDYFPSNYSYW